MRDCLLDSPASFASPLLFVSSRWEQRPQVELLKQLLECEEAAAGCVRALSPPLDDFRAAGR